MNTGAMNNSSYMHTIFGKVTTLMTTHQYQNANKCFSDQEFSNPPFQRKTL